MHAHLRSAPDAFGVFAKHKEGIAAGDRPPGPSRTETPVSPAEIVPAHEGSDKHVVMAQLTRQAFVVIMHKIPNRANVIFQFFRE
ncbi:MAG: hypothetical protein GDA48_09105 [Hormoscilla sp. GM102CHS1]|nr:hypothetical protein [Hormoscilla sp. GM102CHS1]